MDIAFGHNAIQIMFGLIVQPWCSGRFLNPTPQQVCQLCNPQLKSFLRITCEFRNFPVTDPWMEDYVRFVFSPLHYYAIVGLHLSWKPLFCFADAASVLFTRPCSHEKWKVSQLTLTYFTNCWAESESSHSPNCCLRCAVNFPPHLHWV